MGSPHTTSYLPSLRGGSNRPPGVVAQETRLHSNVTEYTTADREFQKKIDICCWSRNGWEKVSNLPLTLAEATATVLNISTSISEKAFEGNSVVLDADYLKVLDIPSTRGIVPEHCKEALVPCSWFTLTIINRSKKSCYVIANPKKKSWNDSF